MIWRLTSSWRGVRASVTRPASTVEPFAIRTIPPSADGLGPHLELAHQARQRVHVEERVGVHGHEQRKARVAEARVHGVGAAAAVLLVDHDQPLVAQAAVGAR